METELDDRFLSGVEASNLGVQEKKTKTLIVSHSLILPFAVKDLKIAHSPGRFLFEF